MKIVENTINSLANIKTKNYIVYTAVLLTLILLVFIFDKALAVGLIFLGLLLSLTFIFIFKAGIGSKPLYVLLILALAIHLAAATFIFYANFYPFSGGAGGFKTANLVGMKLSENLRQGNFSFQGVPYLKEGKFPYRHYELIVGAIYAITFPEIITGQLFNVWLAILAILAVYLIAIELGATKRMAFLVGLIASFYPSHLLYGSLLLKDSLVTALAMFGLLLCIRLIKNFSLNNFFIFYIILLALVHLRFYIGYALLFTFTISFLALCKKYIKKRIIASIFVIMLLALAPQILENQGIFGATTFRAFFNHEALGFYHENAYQPGSSNVPDCSSCGPDISNSYDISDLTALEDPENYVPVCESSCDGTSPIQNGFGSSWTRERVVFSEHPVKFLFNYLKYSSYILFGPFPWQMIRPQHFLALFETMPWYLLFLLFLFGIYKLIKERNRLILPLIIFALMATGVMVLFISNFGIITRIRMPAIMALLCFVPFGIAYINNHWLKNKFFNFFFKETKI